MVALLCRWTKSQSPRALATPMVIMRRTALSRPKMRGSSRTSSAVTWGQACRVGGGRGSYLLHGPAGHVEVPIEHIRADILLPGANCSTLRPAGVLPAGPGQLEPAEDDLSSPGVLQQLRPEGGHRLDPLAVALGGEVEGDRLRLEGGNPTIVKRLSNMSFGISMDKKTDCLSICLNICQAQGHTPWIWKWCEMKNSV